MKLLEKLQVVDFALSTAQKASDFLCNGQLIFSHRALSSIQEDQLASVNFESNVLLNRTIKRMETGNQIITNNSMKSLIDSLKKTKATILEEIGKKLNE